MSSESDRATAGQDPWSSLLEAGLRLVAEITQPASSTAADNARARGRSTDSPLEIERDEQTRQTSVKFRLPEPEVIDRALEGLKGLLDGLRARQR